MKELTDCLGKAIGASVDIFSDDSVSGGCIHDSRRIRTSHGIFFVKLAPLSNRSLLETELEGLIALSQTQTIRSPKPIAAGPFENKFALIMEWIDLRPLDSKSGARMGDKLADLHSKSGDRFGWTIDNFIGATPQKNDPCDSWPEFFRDQRLIFQITLAEENGYTIHSAEPLLGSIETFFDASSLPSPTPLHGDLWGGNAAADEGGDPVLFDPAFYYGDPETDIAFTRFFGGFPQSFYHRYQERIPPRPGWKLRQNLYNLYHVLNHLNLFGSSYLSQANRLIGELNEAVMKGGAGR